MSLIIIFVCFALGVQIYFLYDSLQKAKRMKNVLAEKGKCKVEDYYIPSHEFGNTSYERVLLDKLFTQTLLIKTKMVYLALTI